MSRYAKSIRPAHLLCATFLASLPVQALAQAGPWPARPVRIVVGFPPGGIVDFAARAVAPGLSEALRQPSTPPPPSKSELIPTWSMPMSCTT